MGSRNRLLTVPGRMAFGSLVEPRVTDYGSEWSLGLELTNEEAQPLIEAMLAAVDDAMARDPKWKTAKDYNKPWGPARDKQPDGTLVDNPDKVLIRIKRKTEKKYRGELTKQDPPILWDSLGRVVNGQVKEVGWGSIIKVQFEFFPYSMGSCGIATDLQGVQIIELKERELAPPPVEGGWVVDSEDEVVTLMTDAS